MGQFNVINRQSMQPGQNEDITVVLANFDAIAQVLASLDNSNIAANAGILASKLAGFPNNPLLALLGDGTWGTIGAVPLGGIVPYVGATAPTSGGWLLADGSLVSRATYANLFGLIGETWGAGDGSTTFGLPDLRGRTLVGLGTHTNVNALAKTDGAALADRQPKHKHFQAREVVSFTPGGTPFSITGAAVTRDVPTTDTSSNMLDTPAFAVVNYLIKT